MRILWINHRDPKHPHAGGAEVRFWEIASRLVRHGYEVTLLCERVDGLPTEEKVNSVNIKRMGNRFSIHLLAPLYVIKHGHEYNLIIDDIAHAVPWFSTLVTRTPVIAQVHHLHQEVLFIELPKYIAPLVADLEKLLPKVYNYFIAVSRSTKNALVYNFGINPKNVFVVPNGVDLAKYRPGSKDPKPTVLWVGRIKRYKNLEDLLYVYRVVEKNVRDAQLVIIGAGDYEHKVKMLAKRLSLRNVLFLGKVSEEEKIMWMQKAWVLVSTSIVEGWGITITEAAACGTPAIAYNVPGLRDSIKHMKTGILVEPRNLRDLAKAIILILTDANLRKKFSINAIKYTQSLDWNRIARLFIKIIEYFAKQ